MRHVIKTGESCSRARSLTTLLADTRFGSIFNLKSGQGFSLVLLCQLFCLAVAHAAGPSVDVSSGVDRNALNPGDTLTLIVSVTSSDEVSATQPNLPPLKDFEVLNEWSSQEARASLVTTPNGPQFKTVRVARFNYMLQPKRQGSLSIPGVEVVVEGKSYITKPISIKVAPGAGQAARNAPPGGGGRAIPPPGFGDEDDQDDDLFQQLLRRAPPQGAAGSRTLPINPNEAFFIQLDTDKKEAYVGEQVTASWYLYTRGQIRDLDTLKYPALKGFWKEDLEIATHLNFVDEVVNGIPYKKALLASFALFPIKDGISTIDPYQAKCSVVTATDPFSGMGFGQAYTYTKASAELKMLIKPLPTEGRPSNFSGAVGDFQVTSRIEDHNPVANQPFAFKIRFEGRGNAKLIDLPPFEPPQGIEIYDTQKDAKFFKSGTSYKDFTLNLVARAEGDYTIPSVGTSIFDPQTKKYVTKMTEPIHIHVAKGEGKAPDSSMPLGTGGGSGAKKKVEDLEPHLQTQWRAGFSVPVAEQAIGFSGLFGLIGLTLLWRARTELGWGQKKKDLNRQLKARLQRVNEKVGKGDYRAVGLEMTNTVYFVLGALSGEGGANVELSKLLLKAPPSVRRELAEPLTKQMEVFQILTFAPENVVGSLKNPDQLRRAVSDMTKLMERAVSLGVSSGRSDEFGSGPTAS